MPDPRPRVTSLDQLIDVGTRIQRHIEHLTRLWITEDHNAYAPRGADDSPGGGTTTGDPTPAIADQQRKHRDRDRIGARLVQIDADLTALARSFETRTPDRPCNCCRLELATHGQDHTGRPTLCHPCDRYLHRMGEPCTPAIHEDRPRIRWCECPPECCDPCPDHAAEGRRLSERCKRRMAPDRRGLTA